MSQEDNILVINPGSTSTKVGVFKGEQLIFSQSIKHPSEEFAPFKTVIEQLDIRLKAVYEVMASKQFNMKSLSAVAGRGGFLHPLVSGTYAVNKDMLQDLKAATYGEHASNLGAIMAYEIAKKNDIQAFIVNPIVVDELCDEARVSGLPEIERMSHLHALNVKAVSRKIAKQIGKDYSKSRFIIAHLGGGISIVAHKDGRAIDVNNANNEGPFSPERAGGLPTLELVKLCYSHRYTEQEMLSKLTKESGLYAYFGTKDTCFIEEKAIEGNRKAKAILDAMIFQIAKEIGAMATVLEGDIDGIILTRGLSHSNYIVSRVKKRIHFLSQIFVVPGEEELQALAEGAYRVLNGEEQEKIYQSIQSEVSSLT